MNRICSKHLREPVKLDIECVGCELEKLRTMINNLIENYEKEKTTMIHLLIKFIDDDQLDEIRKYGDMARNILNKLESDKIVVRKTKTIDS